MHPDGFSIQEALLLSALLCGVTPDKPVIHRLQLFFCANFIVGKENAEEDFQRSIETEVNKQTGEKYWNRADRGVYELTPKGHGRAVRQFPNVKPTYWPASRISEVRYSLTGWYRGHHLLLERQGQDFRVTLDAKQYPTCKAAAAHLGLNTEDRSAARVFYNLAVSYKFAVVT